ncbi:hypothetical protein O9993_17180 [Vibrio lentus]|nr:hypothetical protein [Vibrio lentus]
MLDYAGMVVVFFSYLGASPNGGSGSDFLTTTNRAATAAGGDTALMATHFFWFWRVDCI